MELSVALIILLSVVIIAAAVIYLTATILQLFKINAGLSVVVPLVGQIVTKTVPVNPVLDDINVNLAATRDALENLFYKKAGQDAGGLVESCFPGQGSQYLRRVGRSGPVVNVGEEYARGAAILGSLVGLLTGAAPAAAAPAPAAAAPAPPPGRVTRGRVDATGARPWESGPVRPPAASGPVRPPAAAAPPAKAADGRIVRGRVSAKGSRPWER